MINLRKSKSLSLNKLFVKNVETNISKKKDLQHKMMMDILIKMNE